MKSVLNLSVEKVKESRIKEVDFNNIPFGKFFSDHMIEMDWHKGHWETPKLRPFQNISIHPATSALHYGQAIFEGMKAYKTESGEVLLFRPDKNAARFNYSASRMAMPTIPEDQFVELLLELLKLDRSWVPTGEDGALYIRPFMFATNEMVGVKIAEHYKFMVITCPVGKYYAKPVSVLVQDEYFRAFPGGTGAAKAAGNYGGTYYPAGLAMKEGYDQILWLDVVEKKYVQEIGTMNFFVQIDGEVLTPPVSDSILDGVTRMSVISVLKDMGYKVSEREISIDEIVEAHKAGKLQAAFGTGTAATIAFIREIGYREERMALPEFDDNYVAYKVKDKLEGIKRGRYEDTYGWNVSV